MEMRAHFANDVDIEQSEKNHGFEKEQQLKQQRVTTFGNVDVVDVNMHTLGARINDFKHDSKNMNIIEELIDDVLQKAEAEVGKQQTQQETIKANANNNNKQAAGKEKRSSFNIPDFKNGKVVNRARGLVVRLFDVLCNCANTATAPATRMKFRGKRAATLNGTAAGTDAADVLPVENVEREIIKEKLKKDKSNEKAASTDTKLEQ